MKIVSIRRISQLFFFLLFIGFCVVSTLGTEWWQLRGWPVNWFLQLDPLVAIGTLLTTQTLYAGLLWALATIVLTIVFGRFFCSWVCPFGTIHHFVGYAWRRTEFCPADSAQPLSPGANLQVLPPDFPARDGGRQRDRAPDSGGAQPAGDPGADRRGVLHHGRPVGGAEGHPEGRKNRRDDSRVRRGMDRLRAVSPGRKHSRVVASVGIARPHPPPPPVDQSGPAASSGPDQPGRFRDGAKLRAGVADRIRFSRGHIP